MPKIFEQDGYRFFFYSNEHRPIHVHVRRGNGEAVFIMDEEIQLRESQGMKLKESPDSGGGTCVGTQRAYYEGLA